MFTLAVRDIRSVVMLTALNLAWLVFFFIVIPTSKTTFLLFFFYALLVCGSLLWILTWQKYVEKVVFTTDMAKWAAFPCNENQRKSVQVWLTLTLVFFWLPTMIFFFFFQYEVVDWFDKFRFYIGLALAHLLLMDALNQFASFLKWYKSPESEPQDKFPPTGA